MINLEPIPQKIQKRLFEKMRVLGRNKPKSPNTSKSKEVKYGLTHAKMATRSTFLRMTSGQLNPVILQGGKLAGSDALGAQVPSGYDEVYGPRKYDVQSEELFAQEAKNYMESAAKSVFDTFTDEQTELAGKLGTLKKTTTVNSNNKRPIPGVTSIDASFKGGVKALREATISWICWDWEELNLLMPHFLAHGKTVMVEWGWVYDTNSINNLFDFIEYDALNNSFISANAFTDYRQFIVDREGDLDMMVGIVKNFEFTTREDGGFDCQTIISSVGASIMNNPQPNDAILDPGITYNLSINQDEKEVAEAIEDAVGEIGTTMDLVGDKAGVVRVDPGQKTQTEASDSLIQLNTNATLKSFVKNIDRYILEQSLKSGEIYSNGAIQHGKQRDIAWIRNKFITQAGDNQGLTKSEGGVINFFRNLVGADKATIDLALKRPNANYWVRWGWFEDNVLSKFLSITSNATYDVLTEFRSVEKTAVSEKHPAGYESVQIKNHSELETMNINNHILPGQFKPLGPKEAEAEIEIIAGIGDYQRKTGKLKTVQIPGDWEYLHDLSRIISENFDIFTTGYDTVKVGERDVYAPDSLTPVIGGKIQSTDFTKGFDTGFNGGGYGEPEREIIGTEDITEDIPGKFGYLRNMLINTKVLKEAFGVARGKMTAEPVNVLECIESMFTLLNQDLDFWNFNLVVDSPEDRRVKIIDEQTTAFDFNRPGGTIAQKSVDSGFGMKQQDGTTGPGVFYFPVWRKDSMVKRQNIVAKIPDELALTTMYGANMDELKDFANPGSQFADKEGVALAGLYNNQLDENKKQLDIAIKNSNTKNIGTLTEYPDKIYNLYGVDGSTDDIETFIKQNSKELETAYEARYAEISDFLKTSNTQKRKKLEVNGGIPAPMPDNLTARQLGMLLEEEYGDQVFADTFGSTLEMGQVLSSKYNKDGTMKIGLQQSVSFLTTQHGIYKQANTALLIPLELELEIDGIGGIYPGNSFHSTYIPSAYQSKTVFQAFDVNHRLDASGWTTTIVGKMRSTISNIFKGFKTLEQLKTEQFENYLNKATNQEIDRKNKIEGEGGSREIIPQQI